MRNAPGGWPRPTVADWLAQATVPVPVASGHRVARLLPALEAPLFRGRRVQHLPPLPSPGAGPRRRPVQRDGPVVLIARGGRGVIPEMSQIGGRAAKLSVRFNRHLVVRPHAAWRKGLSPARRSSAASQELGRRLVDEDGAQDEPAGGEQATGRDRPAGVEDRLELAAEALDRGGAQAVEQAAHLRVVGVRVGAALGGHEGLAALGAACAQHRLPVVAVRRTKRTAPGRPSRRAGATTLPRRWPGSGRPGAGSGPRPPPRPGAASDRRPSRAGRSAPSAPRRVPNRGNAGRTLDRLEELLRSISRVASLGGTPRRARPARGC